MSQERWTIYVDGDDVYTKELPNFKPVEVVPVGALEAALEEARRYREALEWYADERNHDASPFSSAYTVSRDKGQFARSALVSGERE